MILRKPWLDFVGTASSRTQSRISWMCCLAVRSVYVLMNTIMTRRWRQRGRAEKSGSSGLSREGDKEPPVLREEEDGGFGKLVYFLLLPGEWYEMKD
jgi:hypothetical protein